MRAMGIIMALLLAPPAVAADQVDELTPERRQEMQKKAGELNAEGERQYERGEFVKAKESFRHVLEMTRALYSKERFPHGHADLATSIHNLAALHQAAGEYGKAEPLFREALEMYRALYP